MDMGGYIGIGGILVGAAIAIWAAIYAFPRKRLEWFIESDSLLSRRVVKSDDPVKVSIGNTIVPRPYVATIFVESRGRAAIRSDDFDQGKPITFDLGVPIAAVFDTDPAFNIPDPDEGIVEMPPVLMSRGDRFRCRLMVVDDASSARITHSLADVKVTYTSDGPSLSPRARIVVRAMNRFAFATLIGGSVALALGLAQSLLG